MDNQFLNLDKRLPERAAFLLRPVRKVIALPDLQTAYKVQFSFVKE